jgi:alkylresorcinol/alkylpyrone synthase
MTTFAGPGDHNHATKGVGMAELLSVATALAEHCVSAADTKRYLAGALPAGAAARMARMVDAAGNQTRYGVLPLDELRRLETIEARNRVYMQHAVRLGGGAARAALHAAGLAPDAIGAVIGVSSTGYLMPTLETHLLEHLRLAPSCRRLPLTQLGCAGGAAGLALAAQLCAGAPAATVLVVSVELPSLSFPSTEPSPTDVIAALQFGDGAAAAVVASGATQRGPEVLAAGSVVFPGTLERDGVHLTTGGLRLRRPRGLAEILRRTLGDAVDGFLARHGVARGDIAFWVVHPRNPELLDAAAASLQLPDGAVAASRAVWRRSGNLISAAVFHVLNELRSAAPPPPGRLGVMVAFGAGFGCEMVLMQSHGWLSDGAAAARGAA